MKKRTTINRPGQKSLLVDATRKKTNVAKTKNNALTYKSSLYKVLDLFFIAGASRKMSKADITRMFDSALAENTDLALKCIFWARDIRGGAGERRFFRYCMEHLRVYYPELYQTVAVYVPEYGRWDDLFYDIATARVNTRHIRKGLQESNGLLAKWLPRKGKVARIIKDLLHLSDRNYRQTIVKLSNTVEQKMCANAWRAIDYGHVPSVAMNKYRKAFYRNDEKRFTDFISLVTKGVKKINAKAIFPHTLVRAIYQGEDAKAVQAQWQNLPDYMGDSTERIIPVCDTSGSMKDNNNLPMDVSLALGVYISERNKGPFKDAFITFSAKPEMHYVKGTLAQRLNTIRNANAGWNTNLVAVFDLILHTAVQAKLAEKEMPEKVLVISDMEFDGSNTVYVGCGREQKEASLRFLNNYDAIKARYAVAGYNMPTVVFWNVNGRANNVPATKDDRVGLVSGFSPSIMESILAGKIYSPAQLMLRTIDSDRYRPIHS